MTEGSDARAKWRPFVIAGSLAVSVVLFTIILKASTALLDRSVRQQSVLGDVLTGAALGPVFSSCSPTCALILVTVLPVSFAEGLVFIAADALGPAGMVLLVALLGRALVRRLGWLANPNGWFRRTIGVLFVLVGMAIIIGFDKQLQTWILDAGWYDPIAGLEELFGG